MAHDRIVLEGLDFFGFHGAKPPERELGQRFVVDVALSLDLRPAGTTDDLARGVDYGAVYRAVQAVVEGEPHYLIESVAEGIAQALLAAFPIREVWVRVSKPSAPIRGARFSRVAVEIARSRRNAD